MTKTVLIKTERKRKNKVITWRAKCPTCSSYNLVDTPDIGGIIESRKVCNHYVGMDSISDKMIFSKKEDNK